MKTSVLCLMMVLSFFSKAETVDRLPNVYVQMFEPDSSIEKGKASVKLVLNRSVDAAYYRPAFDDEWTRIKMNKKDKQVILSLDAESHQFRFVKKGFHETTGYVGLKSQNYYEVQVTVYKEELVIPKYPSTSRKPAIYLYSETPLDLSLSVSPHGKFEYVYPQMSGTWNIHVDGNQLTVDDKVYDYLFWEGLHPTIEYNKNEGYVVAGKDVNVFLEEKLDYMGFNAREKQDFICYWGPILNKNQFNKIHFLTGDQYNQEIATYESSVKIDSELRVLMLFESIDEPVKLIEQNLPQIERKGLTLIEWGGADVSSTQFN